MFSRAINYNRLGKILKSFNNTTVQKQKLCLATPLCKNQTQEEMDHFQDNPFLSKYAEKLKQKADTKPEEFQSSVDNLKEKARQEVEDKRKSLEEERKRQKDMATQKKAKGLDGILKLELLQEKSAEEVTEIWKEHHSHKHCVFSVIPSEEYYKLHERTQAFPTFVYPLARGTGYEFMMQQFDGHDCHFTSLIMYQRHQENAPPCFSMTHYTELAESKGIVLMNSELDKDFISVNEAQLLALQVQMYYGRNSEDKFELVKKFTNSPSEFHHMELVVEFEKYKKDAGDLKDGTWV